MKIMAASLSRPPTNHDGINFVSASFKVAHYRHSRWSLGCGHNFFGASGLGCIMRMKLMPDRVETLAWPRPTVFQARGF